MNSTKKEQPQLAKHDSTILDLAFVMDCTSSMSDYISSATKNIRKIVEEIVANEKSDVNLALVEYRDHPPQDTSFVTRSHDFTSKIGKMKSWLEGCSAEGGGDISEAVACGLHQLLKLSWRQKATKIAVLICDAPPHGLGESTDSAVDGFPKGCPDGLDPMEITNQLAEKGVTLYVVGCEPSINDYKDFFMGLAYLTGGQYVPLAAAKSLTQVIVGGAQEEISLEKWMEEVNREVQAEVEAKGAGAFDEDAMSRKIMTGLNARGVQAKQLQQNNAGMGHHVSEHAKKISGMKNLAAYRKSVPPPPRMGHHVLGHSAPPPPRMGHHVSGHSAPPPLRMGHHVSYHSTLPLSKMGHHVSGHSTLPLSRMGHHVSGHSTLPLSRMGHHVSGHSAPPPPSFAAAQPTSSADDVYECHTGEIQLEQAQRMVQKSKMRHQAWFS